MPLRKEPKETVTYPASKRKAPPFKPQRPSQVPRIATTESESSLKTSRTASTTTTKRSNAISSKWGPKADGVGKTSTAAKKKPSHIAKKAVIAISEAEKEDEEDDHDVIMSDVAKAGASESSDDGLGDNPLSASMRAAPKNKRKPPARSPSLIYLSEETVGPSADPLQPPIPSQSTSIPTIPRPLLLRLLHENFTSPTTKIDKQAIEVLQKYFEVFVREAIARAALRKREVAERGEVGSQSEVGWLELEDLEAVMGGLVVDF